jgi:hypothetical protein
LVGIAALLALPVVLGSAYAVLYVGYGWTVPCSPGLPVCLANDGVHALQALMVPLLPWPELLIVAPPPGNVTESEACSACAFQPVFLNCAADTGIADPVSAALYLLQEKAPFVVRYVAGELEIFFPTVSRFLKTFSMYTSAPKESMYFCSLLSLSSSLPLTSMLAVFLVRMASVAVVLTGSLALVSVRLGLSLFSLFVVGVSALRTATE